MMSSDHTGGSEVGVSGYEMQVGCPECGYHTDTRKISQTETVICGQDNPGSDNHGCGEELAATIEVVDSTSSKGNRNENEAKDIHSRIYGAGVEKVDAYTNHDPFGFVDLVAITDDRPVKFVQVKTNRFTTEAKQKYQQRLRHLPRDNAVFEVWVRVDREGWEIYSFDGDEFTKAAEIDTCDTSKARGEYAELVEQGIVA